MYDKFESYVTVKQAALALNITDGAVRKHIECGNLTAVIRFNVMLIAYSELDRFARERRVAGRPKASAEAESE
jgi:uncharacterized oligopeptide transporter (OPT) family protein